jgi:hypothetical protein
MNLTQKDSLNILSLGASTTQEEIKLAYRKACAQYHPDRNPAGLEMMKLVNLAFDALQDYKPGEIKDSQDTVEMYGEKINEALNILISLGLEIELCGAWVWVHGDSYPNRAILKENGFMWAPKKKLWYFRPENYKSFGRGKFSMDEIREKHGSQKITRTQKNIEKAA